MSVHGIVGYADNVNSLCHVGRTSLDAGRHTAQTRKKTKLNIPNQQVFLILPQDEVNEMREREAQAKTDADTAAKLKAEEDKMRAANLDGIESLADDMVRCFIESREIYAAMCSTLG